jgi:pimeloyl-ACP methyl ester carboxylesterase
MDARGIDRAAVVGHSWGASVALALALAAPQRVTRLALYDAWVFEEQLPSFFLWARVGGVGEALFSLYYDERADERMAAAFHDRRRVSEGFVEAVDRALRRPGTKAAALAAVRGQQYAEMERRYGSITQPALLLWGREDAVTPLRYGERLGRELPAARLVVYSRCGHFPMIEAAAASTDDLAAFLAEEQP